MTELLQTRTQLPRIAFPKIGLPVPSSSPGLNRPNGPQSSTAQPVPLRSVQVQAHDADSGVRPPELAASALLRIARAAVAPRSRPHLEITPHNRFVLEQEWLGRVDALAQDHFTAVLLEATGIADEEVADISWDLVSDADTPLVVPGALFYWVIGYRIENGERRGESRLLFKRLLPWTPAESRDAEERASRLVKQLAGDSAP